VKVPYMDLKARNAPLRSELSRAIEAVMESGNFSGGPFVERFEEDFATYCGTRHAIGVGSGTDALWLALSAMGIGPGDEVITVPMTFVATVEAILRTGATPVFVDIDPVSLTMDARQLPKALSSRSKAIVPVHLFGQIADMGPILKFARRHGLRVIEDAAQAHGGRWNGRMAGSLADAGCFSFFPGKNLGGIGEAGAVTTDDANLARQIRVLRNHGQLEKNRHDQIGWNGRMDAIQAAVLSVKLRYLDETNRIRADHARLYQQALSGIPDLVLPSERAGSTHAWHIHAIRVGGRGRLIREFRRSGIGYGVHYPVPVHLQPAYRCLGFRKGDFPVSEGCANEFVSLPIGPELSVSQIDEVSTAIARWAGSSAVASYRARTESTSPSHAEI
jgi:dTDP-4-amino-4,6-dideoxygalactose transaminase